MFLQVLINDLSNDILKKNDKNNKKINIQDFKSTNKSASSNIIFNELPIQFSKQKSNLKTKRENNIILYNNMIDDNLSNSNLKEYSIIQKNIKSQKVTVKQIIFHYLCCFKNKNIDKIEDIRKKILSEEQLFSFYYILGALNDIIIENNHNFKIDLKKNKNLVPNKNIYELRKKLN